MRGAEVTGGPDQTSRSTDLNGGAGILVVGTAPSSGHSDRPLGLREFSAAFSIEPKDQGAVEMRGVTLAFCAFVASAAGAVELPQKSFYSGNDVYDFCQHDRLAALTYVAGLYDGAAHAAWAIDGMRGLGKPNDVGVDFALKRVVGYCKPEHATLEQVTDVFCKYLREFPEKRDGLPPILFSEALTKAWPCPGD